MESNGSINLVPLNCIRFFSNYELTTPLLKDIIIKIKT